MNTLSRQYIHVYPNRIETYCEPPLYLFVLKNTPPFHVVSAEFAGILEGDHFETEIVVESGACLSLSTQEAAKLMAMPSGNARHDWHIVLQPNSQLTFLPNEVIPFAQSDFTQSVVCEMKSSATFIWGEVAVAGRLARSEWFQFRHYHSRISVIEWESSTPLYHENLCLRPASGQSDGLDIWGGFRAWGSLVAIRNEKSCAGLSPPTLEYASTLRSRAYTSGGEKDNSSEEDARLGHYQGLSSLPGGFLWRIMAFEAQVIQHQLQIMATFAENQASSWSESRVTEPEENGKKSLNAVN